MSLRKKKEAQKLNFIVPTKSTTGGKKEKKIQKNLQNKSKDKNNKCSSWVTAVRVLSLTKSHRLPRLPSNTVLISWPAVGEAQILIWSYSCVFLPPMSTAIRTSALSSMGALNDLLYIPRTQSLPSWPCGFNLQVEQLVGRFGVFFLSHILPLGFNCGFISTFTCGSSTGVCSWGCSGGLGLAREGQVWRWWAVRVAGVLAAPSTQGSWWLGQQEI